MTRRLFIVLALILVPAWGLTASHAADGTWIFAVSGDSRNAGDVVMPAIADGVHKHGAKFYWHLGDFRKIYDFDEDMQHQPEHLARPMVIIEYEERAWDDFIASQIVPFGSTPVYLAMGNHETIPPKTREGCIQQFADWLDAPTLREQRLKDDPADHLLRFYYHWIQGGVDFVTLDNASKDQFDAAQIKWFEGVLQRAEANPEVHAIVVGMHEALPNSISANHSMNESPAGTESGLRVYGDLLKSHKHVYVLASHSHYYMDGIFNTEYWRTHGGVLPGWIIGSAGAVRYPLPAEASQAKAAQTNVYGYLLGTVHPDGQIDLSFQAIQEPDIPPAVVTRYTPQFVHWCFAENSQTTKPGK